MNIINLTPHEIRIYNEDRYLILVAPPSGQIARIPVSRTRTDRIAGIPIYQTVTGEPEGLPDRADDTIYIVSGMFRSLAPRDDLYQPGELIRDGNRNPIGCVGLSQ